MLLNTIIDHMELYKNEPGIKRMYEFCKYLENDQEVFSREMDRDFIFYTMNELFGDSTHKIIYSAFVEHTYFVTDKSLNKNTETKQLTIESLRYITRFLWKNNLWEDIIFPIFFQLFDELMKKSFDYIEKFNQRLTLYLSHWEKIIEYINEFFFDENYINGFYEYIKFNSHLYYLMNKITSLEQHLLCEASSLDIIEYKNCLQVTKKRDIFIENFFVKIKPKLLHLSVKTVDILKKCNLFLINLNNIDDSGELSRIICQTIAKYLKTRKDLIQSIASSISLSTTFNEDFMLLNKDNISQKASLRSSSSDSTSSTDSEDVNRPQNVCVKCTVVSEKRSRPHNSIISTSHRSKRKYHSMFDLLNSYLFIYGNAKVFMDEFKNYLSNRILTFASIEFLQNEKHFLEFLMQCFGKELVYNCFNMVDNVIDSLNKNCSKLCRKQKTVVDFIILTPSVWPEMFVKEETHIPKHIKTHSTKFEKKFQAENPNRLLDWYPDRDILEVEVTINDITRTYQCTANQGMILSLFSDHVLLSYDDLLNNSSIVNMDILKSVLSYWQDIGVIVAVDENSFQLVKSFT